MTDRPEHETDQPDEAEAPASSDDAFEEALDAAEVFDELAGEEPAKPAKPEPLEEQAAPGEAARYEEAAFADDFDLSGSAARIEAALEAADASLLEDAAAEDAGSDESAAPAEMIRESVPASARGQSIGQLFRAVVRHSPPSRIRIESDSIGALFRRFIEQE